jgi:hypothetical protein
MAEPRQTTIAIDPASDDIALPVKLVRGNDAYVQRLRHRFRFFLGEWFLDLRLGAPYYDRVLVKNPDERVVRAVLTQIIQTTPGTLRIEKMRYAFDDRARTLTLDELEIRTSDGDLLKLDSEDFIIRLPVAEEG